MRRSGGGGGEGGGEGEGGGGDVALTAINLQQYNTPKSFSGFKAKSRCTGYVIHVTHALTRTCGFDKTPRQVSICSDQFTHLFQSSLSCSRVV